MAELALMTELVSITELVSMAGPASRLELPSSKGRV
jgi:hypothetical protein